MRLSDEAIDEFHQLYPELDTIQRQQAEENFTRYLELVLRMYERIQGDPEAHTRFLSLTGKGPTGTMASERFDPASDDNRYANP